MAPQMFSRFMATLSIVLVRDWKAKVEERERRPRQEKSDDDDDNDEVNNDQR